MVFTRYQTVQLTKQSQYSKQSSIPRFRATTEAFSTPEATIRHRVAGRTSSSRVRRYRQNLSPAEEKTLVRWISQLTITGYQAIPALVVEMVERQRTQISMTLSSFRPLGKDWLNGSRTRYTEIQGVWTRAIESVRRNAISVEAMNTWFDAVTELFLQHQYPPACVDNLDESGFAVGANQLSRALVKIREKSSWEVVKGRLEWITAMECSCRGFAADFQSSTHEYRMNSGRCTKQLAILNKPQWRTSDSHA